VRGVRENLDDPHLVARGTLAPVDQPGHGEVLLPVAPFRFSDAEVRPGRPAGAIAADTGAVLTDVLGLDEQTVQALFADHVVTGGPRR
jgi:crotonobetainyl-CoA:carnitine CoA-transferase CaiB-like acyl-CoA transferase